MEIVMEHIMTFMIGVIFGVGIAIAKIVYTDVKHNGKISEFFEKENIS